MDFKLFGSKSYEELSEEREKVRLEYCAAGDDDGEARRCERLLDAYDDALRELDHREGEYPPPREHGWYLPNDD